MQLFRKALATVLHLPATLLIGLLVRYQRTLSPDHGPLRHLYPYGYCRHHPTCSTYAIQALKERSLPIALVLIARRLLQCHPWKEISEEKMRTVIERM